MSASVGAEIKDASTFASFGIYQQCHLRISWNILESCGLIALFEENVSQEMKIPILTLKQKHITNQVNDTPKQENHQTIAQSLLIDFNSILA